MTPTMSPGDEVASVSTSAPGLGDVGPQIAVLVGPSAARGDLMGDKDRLWKRIDPAVLKTRLLELLTGLGSALPEQDSLNQNFRIKEIEVAVVVGAGGEVGILGTGVEVKGEASLKLKLVRQ